VNQHKKRFEELTNVDGLVVFTGETKSTERKGLWEKARVVFATPQTIESAMFAQQIDLKYVSLIIFDECHRAVGDYAYVFIADQFVRKNPEGHIIGLTASPGGTRERVQEICQNLYIKNVETRTEVDEDVRPYVYAKKTEWVLIELPEEFREVKRLLEETMKEILKELKDKGYVKNTSLKWYNRVNLLKLQSYLLKIKGKEPNAWKALSDVAALMKLHHAHELLETQGIEQLKEYFEKLGKEHTKAAKWIVGHLKIRKAMVLVEKILEKGIEHPKIEKLVEILKKYDGQAIVFTHYRTTAKKVERVLNSNGIKAKQFIGQSTKEGTKGLRQKEQIELIRRFREKEFRVLVATSIGEEGLDIPAVDLVVFYEPVPSEIRKIQRAGRTGRHAPGHVIILITKGTRDEAYYWAARHKEKEMMKVLKENFANPVIMIEGEELYDIRKVHPNAIRGGNSCACS